MNEKVQWYKEVLEIEPQARLFFPLAGMLADEGSLDEACAVLAKGLTFHPGYMEARMLHVELLHRLGRHDEAAREVQVLHRGLAGRAGFWQAWAGQKAMADEDLAMRCMALFLKGVPVSFADILRRGLDSLEAAYGPGGDVRTPAPRPEPAAAADPAARPGSAPAAEQARSAAAAAEPGMKLRPAAGTATLLAAWAAAPEPATGAAPAGDPEARAAGPEAVSESAAETGPVTVAVSEPVAEPEAEPEVVSGPGAASAAQDEAAPAAEAEAVAPATGPAVEAVAADTADHAPAASADAAEEEDDDDFVVDDGAWPPHTRSMAEVFVDQQEYGVAIDIYMDLLARARDEKEIAELGSRLEEIEAMAARPRTTGQADADDEGPRVVDAADDALTVDAGSGAADGELLSMLETLAARVEARAH